MTRSLAHPLAVVVVTLVAYCLTMPRAITLEDAGLFQMVCHLGGLAHPPGYPLFTILCNGFVQVPGVVNGNLLSAVFAALAAAVFYQICMRLTAERIFAYVAALGWGFSAAFWSQAIIIEVYSLAALLFALCWWMLVEYEQSRQTRFWYLACIAFGLALANHWPLMLLSSLGLCAVVSPALMEILGRCRSPKFVGLSLGSVALGLSPYLLMVVVRNPEIALYGSVDNLTQFWLYVSRAAYNDHHAIAGFADKLNYMGWLAEYSFVTQLGVVGLPPVVIGLVASFLVLPRHVAAAVLLTFLGSTYILIMLINFEYSHYFKAIFKPYPVIAFSSIAFWFALGVVTFVKLLSRWTDKAGWLLPPVFVLAVAVTNFPRLDRSDAWLVDTFARTVLNTLPQGAILFTRGDAETGPLGYLHYVEGVRPDIELRDWDNLVFSNRLRDPVSTRKQQEKTVYKFIDEATRPVFVMQPIIKPRVDYGAYVMFNRGGGSHIAFIPDFHVYVDQLVEVYVDRLVQDDHEEYFLFFQLTRFSEQYIGYAIDHDFDVEPAVDERIERLQQTFPGRLVTLRNLLNEPVMPGQKERLIAMAAIAEEDIPEFVPRKSRASFYEHVATAYLLAPANPERARRYLELSLRVYPSNSNPGVCLLGSVYQDLGDASARDDLRARFPKAKCMNAGEEEKGMDKEEET